MNTKLNYFFLLGIVMALFGLVGCQPAELAATASPTATLTLTQTPTFTPTPTVMHSGIPATVEQCDVLHPDTAIYEAEMQQRRNVDRAALTAMSEVHVGFQGSIMSYPKLPLSYRSYLVNPKYILSCSTFADNNGDRVIRIGFATSKTTMMYVDYDEVAAKAFVVGTMDGGETAWTSRFSFEKLFDYIKAGGNNSVEFGVFFDSPRSPYDRPNQEYGFDGVWAFIDSPLDSPLVVHAKTGDGSFTLQTIGDLAVVSHALEAYDEASVQAILEALEKYVWEGSVAEFH